MNKLVFTLFLRMCMACIASTCLLSIAMADVDIKEKERRMRVIERITEYDPRGEIDKATRDAQLARVKGDKHAELDALMVLSMARATVGEPDAKHEDEVRGETLARELGDTYTLSWFLEGKAWGLWWDGRRQEAERLMDDVIADAKANGFESRVAWIYCDKSQLLRRTGRKSEAMDILSKAYAFFERDKQPYGMATVLKHIAQVYGGPLSPPEDQAKAAEYLRRAVALLNVRTFRTSGSVLELGLGLALMRQGDVGAARPHMENALASARAVRYELMASNAEYHLAHLYRKDRQAGKALAYIERALKGGLESWDKHFAVGGQVLRAELLAEMNRSSDALNALADARKVLDGFDNPSSMVEYHERIAAVYERLGEHRDAYRQMQALRAASAKLAEAQKSQLSDELRVRFDVQLKESENARLRAEKGEADTQRLVVVLALALTLLLFASVAYFLRRRALVARIEAQHNKSLAEAEALANQAKSTFLANMSHELRSPLNAVLGFNRLLARDPRLPQDARDDLGIAVRSGEHLYALINQVLDLSKIESGKAVRSDMDFHLPGMLEEMSDMFGMVAEEKKVQLTVQTGPGVPPHVRTDAVKLRQVLINLLNNALKFTEQGGVILRVTAEGKRLRFAVEDTGPGIEAAELERLGQAFEQAQAGRQAKEGTGLGLAISRGFVELMGGCLKMESEPGKGTAISFEIEVQPAARAEAPVPVETRRRRLAPGQPVYRILVVDDWPEGRMLLRRLLEPIGFDVREAGDGAQAISEWEAWKPHLIWMDMRMPVMDGREATRRIRMAEPDRSTIIIALTASTFDDEREQILADGCDDFLRKPFREEVLFEMMARHLGVRFAFEEQDAPGEAQVSCGDLPTELVAQLDDALARLDVDAIDKGLAVISEYDAALAQELAELADGFEYGRMREILGRKMERSEFRACGQSAAPSAACGDHPADNASLIRPAT